MEYFIANLAQLQEKFQHHSQALHGIHQTMAQRFAVVERRLEGVEAATRSTRTAVSDMAQTVLEGARTLDLQADIINQLFENLKGAAALVEFEDFKTTTNKRLDDIERRLE